MSKSNIISGINKSKIIAIIRGLDFSDLEGVCEALVKGGINVMEFTIDHNKKDCVRETCKKIAYAAEKYSGRAYVGAGTVLNTIEAKEVISAGAELIISPNTDTDVIKFTVDAVKVSIPGSMSPSECVNAHSAGADFVKLFPAGELGIAYTKALMAPLSHIPFLIVGGITPENAKSYLELGVNGFGLGSGLILKDAVRDKDYGRIEKQAVKYINAMDV